MQTFSGLTVPQAVKVKAEVPAKILGVKKGEIRIDYDADVIVFDDKIAVLDIFVGSKKDLDENS